MTTERFENEHWIGVSGPARDLYCGVRSTGDVFRPPIAPPTDEEIERLKAAFAASTCHPLANDPDEPPHCETCRYVVDEGDAEPFPEAGYPCPTLRLLAAPYVEHPDYQEAWRP